MSAVHQFKFSPTSRRERKIEPPQTHIPQQANKMPYYTFQLMFYPDCPFLTLSEEDQVTQVMELGVSAMENLAYHIGDHLFETMVLETVVKTNPITITIQVSRPIEEALMDACCRPMLENLQIKQLFVAETDATAKVLRGAYREILT